FLRLKEIRDAGRGGALQGSNGRLSGRSDRERRRLDGRRSAARPAVTSTKIKANPERSTPNAEPRSQSIPVALPIAGSDSSAGAGLQADLKPFTAFGVYGLTAVTCVVAETPGRVSRIEPVSLEMVREQIEVLAKNFPIAATKTGF